jgi:hypothetical protein
MKKNRLAWIVIGVILGAASVVWAQSAPATTPQAPQAQQWQARRQAMREKMQKMKADCEADVQKFCANDKGRDRAHCLVQNKSQLSAACQADVTKMEEFHQHHMMHHQAPPPPADTAPSAGN